ncbi:hypothetical protein B0H34DRAFT_664418 [Crassisporium funariophilum]|nr:hypothetical protein B0H34DRAFT_664418 [Crassisporium funariophilum]
MTSASYRPNVPSSQLFDEKTWLQGGIISAVVFGINIALFTLTFTLLRARIKREIHQEKHPSRQAVWLMAYIWVIFILCTLTMASQAEMTQLGFVDNRDFPGGPAAFQELMFSLPISRLGNVCFFLLNWCSDFLLLWRCLVIFKNSATSVWLIMGLPGVMLLSSFVTGVLYLDRTSRASSSPWDSAFTYTLAYGIVSLTLNVVLTGMIVIRLYLHRQRIAMLVGPRYANQYTSIISMLVESASILYVVVIFFLIPFAMGNALAHIPFSSIGQVQAMASYMIIFRVAQGTAWSSDTATEIATEELSGRLTELGNSRGDAAPHSIAFPVARRGHHYKAKSPIQFQGRALKAMSSGSEDTR